MNTFVEALTNATSGITGSTLWTEVGYTVPLIVIMFTFAFGWYVIKRLLKGGSRGKLKV